MQCIKSARWAGDGPLAIFPGVQAEREKRRVGDERARLRTLNEVVRASKNELEKVASAVGLKPSTLPRFSKAVAQLPDLRVSVTDVNALGFAVHISRTRPLENRDARMFAPNFPKPQTEGFFLLVSRAGTDELIALKRVGWSAGSGRQARFSTKSTIKVPDSVQNGAVNVRVVSDGYIGMEWTVDKVDIPAAPAVEDMGKKEAAS
jgi:antiviral helicase SLH1